MKPLKYRKMPNCLKKALWNSRAVIDPLGLAKISQQLKHMNDDLLYNPKTWSKAFGQLIRSGVGYDQFIKDFYHTQLKIQNAVNTPKGSISLICIVKNDLCRIQVLIDYYRKLGIEHFIALDDNSADGTREYLLSQKDVDLWTSSQNYTTARRQAWISRLIDIYGFNKWYLVVDSDEFLTYPHCEKLSLPVIVQAMQDAGIKRAHCFLLDMYSKNGLFAPFPQNEFVNEYTFFDKSGYSITDRVKLTNLSGGMRVRLFSFESFFLSKSPLFFAEPGFVPCSSHYSFPFSNQGEELNLGVLRHYKFLPQDKEKYLSRLEEANFSNGSSEYALYMNEYQQINNSVYNSDISACYKDSSSLQLLELPQEMQIDVPFTEKILEQISVTTNN